MTFLLKACKNAGAKVTQTVVDSCNFLKTTKCLNHAFQATFKGHAASNTINIKNTILVHFWNSQVCNGVYIVDVYNSVLGLGQACIYCVWIVSLLEPLQIAENSGEL